MKIRAGFVSNSSSSSFALALPKGLDLSSPEPLHDYLYGPAERALSLERYGYAPQEGDHDEIWSEAALAAAFGGDVTEPAEEGSPEATSDKEDLAGAGWPKAESARPTYTTSIGSRAAAGAVWQQLRGREPNEEGALFLWASLLGGGPESDAPDRFSAGDIDKVTYEGLWKQHVAQCVAYARSRLDEVLGPDMVLYELEFADWADNDLGVIMRNAPDNFGAARRWEFSVG